jgi:hypothetical protein
MSKLNVTIPVDSAAQPRIAPAKPAQIGPTAGVFFIFDCETVEPSLTNPKSDTYKSPTHRNPQSVNL